ncbi:MAG: peroxidase family protein, partial [Peptostreptococcaceae bacterium]
APATYLGPPPEGASIEEQGLGWKNSYKTGKGIDTISSGIEGAWKQHPTKWTMGYFETLFRYQWELVKSPAGAYQWLAKDVSEEDMIIDAHDSSKKHRPMMTTADLGILYDPIYNKIGKSYLSNPDKFADDFARAWFKLIHRDMGPISRYLGPEVPCEKLIWQDPIPEVDYELVNKNDIKDIKILILDSNLSISQLVTTAWASASTFRGSDKRGGANGARIALEPQMSWEVNEPDQLEYVLGVLEDIKNEFNYSQVGNKKISLADMIVLGGCVGIEKAGKNAGYKVRVPFIPGRTDALQEDTDVESFSVLEPKADGFRNYLKGKYSVSAEDLLVDRAQLLTLTAPEMTVLLGGMRVLGTNYNNSNYGVFTNRPEVLTNDFFVNLLDMDTVWEPVSDDKEVFEGRDRNTGELKWEGSRVDLVFGSNSQLRAIAEVYASEGSQVKFLKDFVHAWNKVMNADRYDVWVK